MKRHTTMSLLAALAFGAAMAGASGSSYARQANTLSNHDPIRQCERVYNACLQACHDPSLSPYQRAQCNQECIDRDRICMRDIGFARARIPESRTTARLP